LIALQLISLAETSPMNGTATGDDSNSLEIDSIIRRRRTSMFVDDRELDPAVVTELCELASWAPCHKKTWPWQFALITGAARERFGNAVADAMAAAGDEEPRIIKARTKYLRTPALRDATAAAIQNVLLAATARGIATFWSSCPRGCNEVVADFSGFAQDTSVVGIVYLGYTARTVEAPARPAPHLSIISS
jgi:nitroreductase